MAAGRFGGGAGGLPLDVFDGGSARSMGIDAMGRTADGTSGLMPPGLGGTLGATLVEESKHTSGEETNSALGCTFYFVNRSLAEAVADRGPEELIFEYRDNEKSYERLVGPHLPTPGPFRAAGRGMSLSAVNAFLASPEGRATFCDTDCQAVTEKFTWLGVQDFSAKDAKEVTRLVVSRKARLVNIWPYARENHSLYLLLIRVRPGKPGKDARTELRERLRTGGPRAESASSSASDTFPGWKKYLDNLFRNTHHVKHDAVKAARGKSDVVGAMTLHEAGVYDPVAGMYVSDVVIAATEEDKKRASEEEVGAERAAKAAGVPYPVSIPEAAWCFVPYSCERGEVPDPTLYMNSNYIGNIIHIGTLHHFETGQGCHIGTLKHAIFPRGATGDYRTPLRTLPVIEAMLRVT